MYSIHLYVCIVHETLHKEVFKQSVSSTKVVEKPCFKGMSEM